MLTLAAVSGCSLLVTTDGLSAGTTDAGAGMEAEGGMNEGGTPISDAATDAPPPPFCATLSPKPKFCADFDTGALTELGTLTGMVTLDTSASKSPAGSLACEVPTGSAKRGALIQHDFGETPSAYDLSFDVFVDTYDATLDVELISVSFRSPGGGTCVTDVSIRDTVWTLDESCESGGSPTVLASHETVLAARTGRWVHIDASVSFAPSRTYSLAVDGQPLFFALPLMADLKTGDVALLMGITYTQMGATTAKVHLDNVRFDYR